MESNISGRHEKGGGAGCGARSSYESRRVFCECVTSIDLIILIELNLISHEDQISIRFQVVACITIF